MLRFASVAEHVAEQSVELFESLDLEVANDFFVDNCNEMPDDLIVSLRDVRKGNKGRTLLHNAARNGKINAVLYLIRKGCTIDTVDSQLSEKTPLMDAIALKHFDIAIVLVEAGADISKQDVNGEHALHYAARGGSTRMIRSLLKAARTQCEGIQELCAVTNIKLQFPEDVATCAMAKEVLVRLREFGNCAPILKQK
jgi:ankyrin repeat protein